MAEDRIPPLLDDLLEDTLPGLADDEDDQLEEDWGDIWEHLNLLGDTVRTRSLVEFLDRHARGRTVLEVGCGTGLLSCVAARMGATHVYAVEPTSRVHDAQRLVEDSGLSHRVTVIHDRIERLRPRPVDVVFSELLNADPFAEGLLPAMDAAARWRAPGGLLAPVHLDLHVALVAAASNQAEVAAARDIISELGAAWDLAVDPLLQVIDESPPVRSTVSFAELRSTSALAWRGWLGTGERPPARIRLPLTATGSGWIGGAVLWFSAPYDAQLTLNNHPDEATHWGIYVNAWTRPFRVRKGQQVVVEVRMDEEDGVEIVPHRTRP